MDNALITLSKLEDLQTSSSQSLSKLKQILIECLDEIKQQDLEIARLKKEIADKDQILKSSQDIDATEKVTNPEYSYVKDQEGFSSLPKKKKLK